MKDDKKFESIKIPENKLCWACKKQKNRIKDYHNNKRNWDGKATVCKDCQREMWNKNRIKKKHGSKWDL